MHVANTKFHRKAYRNLGNEMRDRWQLPWNSLYEDTCINIYRRVNILLLVRIATRDGLDGRGSNPGGAEIFCTRPDRL